MKKMGELFDKNGKVSKILLRDENTGVYYIYETKDGEIQNNKVSLSQEEFNKLHLALSNIENY